MPVGSHFTMLLFWLSLGPYFTGALTTDLAAQSGDSFKLKVDVDLATIEVYARDGEGKPVPNLKREDFRIYEDGKEQEIVSFDAVDGIADILPSTLPLFASGKAPRGKTVLILFDAVSIPKSKFREFCDSAARFVREHMQPRDLFAVILWDGTMRIIQNFTDDSEAVLDAIAVAAQAGRWGNFEDMLRFLEQIHDSIASIKGQKSVLVYGHSAGRFGGSSLSETINRTLNSARKANVTYYMIDPGRAKTIELAAPEMPVTSSEVELSRQSASLGSTLRIPPAAHSMHSLVAASGGFSIANMDEIDVRLDTLNQQISSYYILGFQSSNLKHTGDFRKVRVTTKAKGVILKYPPGYQDRRPVDVLESSRQEQALLTALAAPGIASRLALTFRPAYFFDASRPARVLIAAKIGMDGIAFRRKGTQISADLHIMGAAYAENGSLVARFSEILPIRLDKDKELEFRKQSLAYRNYLRLRPGRYRLRLAASDESSNLGIAEQELEVPAVSGDGVSLSSLVIAEHSEEFPEVMESLRAQLLDPGDPLLLSRTEIQPSVDNRMPVRSPVAVMFQIYNLPQPAGQVELVARIKLLDAGGERFALSPISLKNVLSVVRPGEAAAGLRLPLQGVPAGKYRLVVGISAPGSEQIVTTQTDLEFF